MAVQLPCGNTAGSDQTTGAEMIGNDAFELIGSIAIAIDYHYLVSFKE
jgi:pyruvate/2-oxoglutarate dehydrogenase complex dihydrolipoamide dehydrogenase (E3) component